MSTKYTISLCWEKIKESGKIRKHTNGNHYFSIDVVAKRQIDNYGKDASAFMTQTKEEREAGIDKKYVGDGNMFVFNDSPDPRALEVDEETFFGDEK
jgi:hypothetical protein